jgi:hypothetical protein
LPATSPHVVAVSATAPEGWCLNPSTDLDVKASYTNFGQSVIDFAAPGGDLDFPNPTDARCTVMISGIGLITMAVQQFDRVVSVGVPPREVVYSFALPPRTAAARRSTRPPRRTSWTPFWRSFAGEAQKQADPQPRSRD